MRRNDFDRRNMGFQDIQMGRQQGLMRNMPGLMGNQPGFMGNQPSLMGSQTSLMGNQPNLMGNQPSLMGNQPSLMGNQPSLMGNQPGMMRMPPGGLSNQSGMGQLGNMGPLGNMGQQGNMGSMGSMGLMNNPPGLMGNLGGGGPMNINGLMGNNNNFLGQQNAGSFLGNSGGMRPPTMMGPPPVGPLRMSGPPGPGMIGQPQQIVNRLGGDGGGSMPSLLGDPMGFNNRRDDNNSSRGFFPSGRSPSGDHNRNNFRRLDNRGSGDGNRFQKKRPFSSASNDSNPRAQIPSLTGGPDDKMKPYFCRLCRVQLSSAQEFQNHLASDSHRRGTGLVSMNANNQREPIPSLASKFSRNRIQGPGDNQCVVCNRNYHGSYYAHSMTTDHKNRAKLIGKGCLLCKTGKFAIYTDYVQHLDSARHKEKKAEINQKNAGTTDKKTETGSASKPAGNSKVALKVVTPAVKNGSNSVTTTANKVGSKSVTSVKPVATKVEESKEKSGTVQKSIPSLEPEKDVIEIEESTEGDGVMFSQDELIYDPDTAVGQEHVISVTGYFCKLCHKFYNNEAMAKVNHCKTEAHFEKFKDALGLM